MKIKEIWELPTNTYDFENHEAAAKAIVKLTMGGLKMDNENVMLPSEFADKMRGATHNAERQWDAEDAHRAMDSIMCDLLISLGYEEGVEIFRSTPKWYA